MSLPTSANSSRQGAAQGRDTLGAAELNAGACIPFFVCSVLSSFPCQTPMCSPDGWGAPERADSHRPLLSHKITSPHKALPKEQTSCRLSAARPACIQAPWLKAAAGLCPCPFLCMFRDSTVRNGRSSCFNRRPSLTR